MVGFLRVLHTNVLRMIDSRSQLLTADQAFPVHAPV